MPEHRHEVRLEDIPRPPNGNGLSRWINWKIGLKDLIWIVIIIVGFFVQKKGIEDAIDALTKQQALNTVMIEAIRIEIKQEYLLKEVENQRDLSIEQRLNRLENERIRGVGR